MAPNPVAERPTARVGHEPGPAPADLGLPFIHQQETLLRSNWWREVNGESARVTNFVECRRLRGPLEVRALEQALTRLTQRHVTLRTTVQPISQSRIGPAWPTPRKPESLRAFELYYQRIEAPSAFRLTLSDLRALGRDRAERVIRERSAHEMVMPFDLAHAPLARAQLFQCADDEHVLMLSAPHYAVDALSMGICWRDVFELYEAGLAGREPDLPEPSDFHDFVRRQQERHANGGGKATIAYWREQWTTTMAGEPAVSAADLDFVRPLALARGVGRETLRFDPDQAAALRQIAQRSRVTPATLFLAAFTRWLQLRTGRSRFAPWVTCSNRSEPPTWAMVGYLATAVAMPIHVEASVSREQHLRRCRTVLANAVRHQDVSRDVSWRELEVTARATRLRFTYIRIVASVPRDATLVVETVPQLVEGQRAHSGFDVSIGDDGETFSVHFIYGAGRFRPADVHSAGEQYRRLLAGFGDHDAPLSTLQ